MRLILVAVAMTWVGCATTQRCEEPSVQMAFVKACAEKTEDVSFCSCAFNELAKARTCIDFGRVREDEQVQAFLACRGRQS